MGSVLREYGLISHFTSIFSLTYEALIWNKPLVIACTPSSNLRVEHAALELNLRLRYCVRIQPSATDHYHKRAGNGLSAGARATREPCYLYHT